MVVSKVSGGCSLFGRELFSSLSSLCFDRSMMRRSFSSSPHASISTSRFNNVFRRGENERFPPPRVCSAKATASVSSSKGRESEKKKNAIIKKGAGLKVSSFRCASSSSSSESSSFEAGGGGGGKEGKNTSASPKEEEKEEEKKESSGLEKAGFVLDKENNREKNSRRQRGSKSTAHPFARGKRRASEPVAPSSLRVWVCRR